MSPTAIISTAASSSSRKRKHHEPLNAAPSKKLKTATTESEASPEKKKKKSKKRRKVGEEFKRIQASMTISLPPIFAQDPTDGIEEMLDSMILRFVPSLNGVVLAHADLRLSSEKAAIQFDCPYATCHITFEALVWSPAIGMKLSARVKLSSTDHIGLLAHDIFNVSIPKHHIPMSEFVFQHGPAENDPIFGWRASSAKEVDADGDANIPGASAVWGVDSDTNAAIGTWVRVNGSEPLGGGSGEVEFTVVGLRTANNTLTLIGSLQTDPFSPSHVPEVTLSNPSASYSSPKKRRRIVGFGNSDDAAGTATWGASEPLEVQNTAWSSVHSPVEQSPRTTLPSTRTTDLTVPSESEGDLGEETEVANTIIRKRAEAREAAQEEELAATFERERDTRERKEKKKKHKAKRDQGNDLQMAGGKGDGIVEKKKKKKKKRVDGEA